MQSLELLGPISSHGIDNDFDEGGDVDDDDDDGCEDDGNVILFLEVVGAVVVFFAVELGHISNVRLSIHFIFKLILI